MQINVKKRLLLTGLPLALVILAIVILYNNAQKTHEAEKEKAALQLQEADVLAEISRLYVYNSSRVYYTATGQDETGRNIAVWLQKNSREAPVVRPLSEGTTEAEARAIFRQETGSGAKLLSATLGMEENIPVWLFVFKDENSRLNYYYLSFTNGKWWKKVENI